MIGTRLRIVTKSLGSPLSQHCSLGAIRLSIAPLRVEMEWYFMKYQEH
jgi:hypothetical protein